MSDKINGIPESHEHLTDEEVMTLLDRTTERLYRSEQEALKIIGWAAMRGLVSNRPAEVVPDNVLIFPTGVESHLRLQRSQYEKEK